MELVRKALMKFWKPELRQQLGKPSKTPVGRMVMHYLRQRNAFLEKTAVKLADIKPDHNVLEIGFGGGVGLRCAYWRVAEGEGRVFGVDYSPYMVKEAKKYCAAEIALDKVEVLKGDVMAMPFPDNFFDRVFHCNCYYFWKDRERASKEIYRVTKPGGKMVTTLIIDALKELEKEKILTSAQFDPLNYMAGLESAGFENVKIKYITHRDKLVYQAIFAAKPEEAVEPLDEAKQDELLGILEKEVKTYARTQTMFRFRRPVSEEPTDTTTERTTSNSSKTTGDSSDRDSGKQDVTRSKTDTQ